MSDTGYERVCREWSPYFGQVYLARLQSLRPDLAALITDGGI